MTDIPEQDNETDTTERQALVDQLDGVDAELDRISFEMDRLEAERNRLFAEIDRLYTERNRLAGGLRRVDEGSVDHGGGESGVGEGGSGVGVGEGCVQGDGEDHKRGDGLMAVRKAVSFSVVYDGTEGRTAYFYSQTDDGAIWYRPVSETELPWEQTAPPIPAPKEED